MSRIKPLPEVLTLEEAAKYLRLPKEAVREQVAKGLIPGRCVSRKWRFLKAALDQWLRGRDGRTSLLQQAGAFADDETMPALREAIYKARGWPETE
jgi:excisionase family DNA binding protein